MFLFPMIYRALESAGLAVLGNFLWIAVIMVAGAAGLRFMGVV